MRLINSLLFLVFFALGAIGFYFSEPLLSWVDAKTERKEKFLLPNPDPVPLLGSLELKTEKGQVRLRMEPHEAYSPVYEKTSFAHLSEMQIEEGTEVLLNFIQNGYQLVAKGPMNLWVESFDPESPLSPIYLHVSAPQIELVKKGAQDKIFIIYRSKAYSPNKLKESPNNPQQLLLNTNTQTQIGFLKFSLEKETTTELKKREEPGHKKSYDEYIDKEIAKSSSTFSKCRDNRIKEVGTINGKVVIGVRVAKNGEIDEIKIIKSEISDEPLITCLKTALTRIKLAPHSEESIYRLIPLEFE